MASMKILIRATNWVGDAILSLPALRAVRERFPDSPISVLARPYVAELYRDQGVADELIPYDAREEHAGLSGRERLARELRVRKYDVALLLQNAFDAAWLAWRAGIPERIGYNRDGRGILLTKRVKTPRVGEIPAHERFYYLELLRRAGWIDAFPPCETITLHVPETSCRRAEERLLEEGSRPLALRIGVAAGASYGSAKCWPPERFAKTLEMILAATEADVILFGTKAEGPVSEEIAAGMSKPSINLTGKTAIAELPGLLSRCHLFLGNDSGAMHVAAAVGLPVVAVFGPSDPQGTAPVTTRSSMVQQKPYCSPCFLRRCPTDHRCMTAITPAMVAKEMKVMLAGVPTA
jgi:lipopolysaccharide heptosyltransferase II